MSQDVKMPLPKLRDLIHQRGMTQAQAAELAELSPGQLSQMISGKRGFSRASLARIAEALGVGISDILGAQPNHPATQAETDALPCPDDCRLDDQTLRALAPSARSPASFLSTRPVIGAGILSGDQILIDLSTPAQLGEIVVVQVVDPDTTLAVSIVRRWIEPYLVEIGASSGAPVMRIDSGQCGRYWCNILGPVVAVIRQVPPRDNAA